MTGPVFHLSLLSMFRCDPQKFRNGRIFGAPDFVAEVVSPSSVRRDNILKLHKYSDANVKEYWIVDPATEKVIVYDLRSEYGFNIALYTFEDKVPMNLYDGELVIDFTEIKRALQKTQTIPVCYAKFVFFQILFYGN